MTVRATVSGIDYSLNARGRPEGTAVSVYMLDVNAANLVAQTAKLVAFQNAVKGVSLITFDGRTMLAVDVPRETARPASPFAQRESKWLVTATDNVNGQINQFEIGGADLTLTGADGATLDTTTAPGAAFVTSVQTDIVSRDGNAMTFVSAVHVGRNN